MTRVGAAVVCALVSGAVAAAGAGGCSGPSATVEPDAERLAGSVTTLCQLPVLLGYGGPPDQRRMQRRAGDTLLGLAGGHVILPEELQVTAAAAVAAASASDFTDVDSIKLGEQLRALGEDPHRVLTLAAVVSRNRRTIPNTSPIPGFQLGHRLVMDYIVRIEVRQAGRSDVIGTIDSVASGDINEPELGPRGESLGAQKALDEALAKAVRTFAPNLAARSAGGAALMIVEIPAAAAGSALDRLKALQDLYPELTIEQMQALAGSRERFMVLRPGALSGLGLAAGDLLGAPAGKALTSRGALARGLSAGGGLKLVVERAGQRYMLASSAN